MGFSWFFMVFHGIFMGISWFYPTYPGDFHRFSPIFTRFFEIHSSDPAPAPVLRSRPVDHPNAPGRTGEVAIDLWLIKCPILGILDITL